MVDGTDTVVVSVTHVDASATDRHRGGRGRTTRREVAIPVITIDSDAFLPHPPYESCPPISRSVLMNVSLEHSLPFVPYADDDRFPVVAYQSKFDTLEWESPFDPDGELRPSPQVSSLKQPLGHDSGVDSDRDRQETLYHARS